MAHARRAAAHNGLPAFVHVNAAIKKRSCTTGCHHDLLLWLLQKLEAVHLRTAQLSKASEYFSDRETKRAQKEEKKKYINLQ